MTEIEENGFLYGFDRRDKSTFTRETSLEIVRSIEKTNLPYKIIMEVSKEEVLRCVEASKKYMVRKFTNLNRSVLYMPSAKLIYLDCMFDEFEASREFKLRELRNNSKSVDCFDIPITLNNNLDNCSLVQGTIISSDINYLQQHPIINTEIRLSNLVTSTVGASYLHEIVHSLTTRHKHVVKDFYSDELLSMFVELLNIRETSGEEEFLRSVMNRWISFTEGLGLYQIVSSNNDEIRKYFKSFVQAVRLIDIFEQLNIYEKESFLATLKQVLSGGVTLEKFLNGYNIKGIDSGCLLSAKKYLKLTEKYAYYAGNLQNKIK